MISKMNLDAYYYAQTRIHRWRAWLLRHAVYTVLLPIIILGCELFITPRRWGPLISFFSLIFLFSAIYAGLMYFQPSITDRTVAIWKVAQAGLLNLYFALAIWGLISFLGRYRTGTARTTKIVLIVQVCLILSYMVIAMNDAIIIRDDMGFAQSIPRIMYQIRHRKPATKLLLEDLLCNRIPIQGDGRTNRMTPAANRLLAEQWKKTFNETLTRKTYRARTGGRRCPFRSEANGLPYPRFAAAQGRRQG